MLENLKRFYQMSVNLHNPIIESESDEKTYVLAKYFFGFVLSVGMVLSTHQIAEAFNTMRLFTTESILKMQVISVAIFATGSIGKRGSTKVGPFEIDSKAHRLEDKISGLLTFIGVYLSLLSYLLAP